MSCELIDYMGDDNTVVNAARVSFHKTAENYTKEQNDKLINYLAKHGHWTPLAHCFASFRIKIPMFVAMQLDKHTVGLVTNSVSRRYVDDEPEFWFPDEWRGRPENMKQGSSGVIADVDDVGFNSNLSTAEALDSYNALLKLGVAPEQARMVLPMNTMTERIWSGSLAAFARVCKLRLDPHAQKEIQDFAQMINDNLETLYPVSWKALMQND